MAVSSSNATWRLTSRSVSCWLRAEALGADHEVPRLDACDHQSLCTYPRVVGEAPVDVGFAVGVGDEKHPDAVVLAAGERAGEQREALAGERVHEAGVIVRRGLLEGAFSFGPAGTGFTGDGEQAHWWLPCGADLVVMGGWPGSSRWPTRRGHRGRCRGR